MGKFSDDVATFAAKAKVKTLYETRVVVMELFRRVILKTPVDTGRARANWQFFIGDPVPKADDSKDPSGSAAISAVDSGLKNFQLGQVAWLANNLPYIRVLEYGEYPNPNKGTKTVGGYSAQAPQGMVRVTAAEFGSIVERRG